MVQASRPPSSPEPVLPLCICRLCTYVCFMLSMELRMSGCACKDAHVRMYIAGQVVSTNLEERIRSHQELQGGSAPHYANADKFYDWLSNRLVKNGHCMDVFACALDQVGRCEILCCAVLCCAMLCCAMLCVLHGRFFSDHSSLCQPTNIHMVSGDNWACVVAGGSL